MWCWPSWSMELGVSIVKGKLEMYNNMATGGMQVEAQVDYFGLCGQGGSSIFRPCCMWNSGKESACDAGDPGSISGSGRSPGGGHGNPLQYSCLENPMDRGSGVLQFTGSQKVRHDLGTEHARTHAWLTNKRDLFFPSSIWRPKIIICGFLSWLLKHLYLILPSLQTDKLLSACSEVLKRKANKLL